MVITSDRHRTLRLIWTPVLVPLILVLLIGHSEAQVRTVQQPVIQQQGLSTAVSVPDRGRAFLGGVRRGAIGRQRYGGPLRSGTNTGAEYSASSQSVSVYIHDFEAMDQEVLAAAAAARRAQSARTPRSRADHAWDVLSQRHRASR